MKSPLTLIELARELLALPSVTPEGDAGGSQPGEAAVAAYVADFFSSLGADVQVHPVQRGRPNVLASFAAKEEHAPTVALVPHLDTVGVGGMIIPPFEPDIRRGRLHGRGSCDTKGPMAAAMWALQRWARSRHARHSRVNLVFAATMGEEELSTGANALCAAGFRADFAIALEPTELRIVHAAKGVLRLWVEARGRAAHGAVPEEGDNAILRLLPFLRRCQDELAPAFAAAAHPVLGNASLNLGVIRGGTELNIVPDACRAGLDIRTHPGLDNEAALAHVRRAAEGLQIDVHRVGPAFVLPVNHPGIAALAPFAQGLETASWYSDANVFNGHGIPAVAFGPGCIAQAHTVDEFIDLSALDAGGVALERFITEVSRSSFPRAAAPRER